MSPRPAAFRVRLRDWQPGGEAGRALWAEGPPLSGRLPAHQPRVPESGTRQVAWLAQEFPKVLVVVADVMEPGGIVKNRR